MNTPVIVRSTSFKPAAKNVSKVALSHPIEIGLVLDASGSMENYVDLIIAGFNTILEEQKALSHHTKVSLTLFNSTVQHVYNGVDIATASPLEPANYKCSGGTALYDGIMAAIDTVRERVDANPASVVVAILSDGAENASVHHTLPAVRNMISFRQSQGWKFLFIGPKASRTTHLLGRVCKSSM
jgi:Mg-chelatase subunit ChlD